MSSGMYETTVGSLSLRKLEYSYTDSSPFTDTLIYQSKPTQPGPKSRSGSRSRSISRSPKSSMDEKSRRKSKDRDFNGVGRREELESEGEDEVMSVDDEMDELSDSKSSVHTTSRPVTPSQGPMIIPRSSSNGVQNRGKSTSPPPPGGNPNLNSNPKQSPEGVFTLAHKAVCILGLVPGTLGYAKACLENAKDEIKRLSELSQQQVQQPLPENYGGEGNGMRNRIQNRARKAMSFTGFHNTPQGPGQGQGQGYVYDASGKIPNVILGYGLDTKEEEERREKRRKAVDGVIYWQREIDRLEKEEASRGM